MENERYEETIFKANLSDIAERYDDMAQEMEAAVKYAFGNKHTLNLNARNSFSVAYKNLVSSRRSSWRILISEKHKLEGKGSNLLHVLDEKIAKVEQELLNSCDKVLEIIKDYILSPEISNKNIEYEIFFLKMKGDYFRYKAEVVTGDEKKSISDSAKNAYEEATAKAAPLAPTNPIKLGLALNFSVFHYEILKQPTDACNIAKKAFDAAIEQLDSLSEEHYRDSTLIMQLLRDNLTLWTSRDESILNGEIKNSIPPGA